MQNYFLNNLVIFNFNREMDENQNIIPSSSGTFFSSIEEREM
jgi:hypothetical protein